MEEVFSVSTLCDVLQVSRSAYYRYIKGESYQPNEKKKEELRAVADAFWEHKRRYGSRRLVSELQEQGLPIGRHRIRTLMSEQGLVAIQRGCPSLKALFPSGSARTTDSRHGKRICPNLLLKEPFPLAPNRVWVGDLTYLPLTNGKWAYLGQWLDLYSRMIVGWQVSSNMEDSLVINPLRKALRWRKPAAGLIIHSDRGGQYVSDDLKRLLKQYNCQQSMSRADDPYDNAYAESFFSRFKAELLENGAFLSVEDAQTEIFDFIECYYNRKRRHSALGNKSPYEFEHLYYLNQNS